MPMWLCGYVAKWLCGWVFPLPLDIKTPTPAPDRKRKRKWKGTWTEKEETKQKNINVGGRGAAGGGAARQAGTVQGGPGATGSGVASGQAGGRASKQASKQTTIFRCGALQFTFGNQCRLRDHSVWSFKDDNVLILSWGQIIYRRQCLNFKLMSNHFKT